MQKQGEGLKPGVTKRLQMGNVFSQMGFPVRKYINVVTDDKHVFLLLVYGWRFS